MNQRIFFIIISLALFSCQSSLRKNAKVDEPKFRNDSLNCCKDLDQNTLKYKTWINKETGNKLSGYFDGFANNKAVTGFAMINKDTSFIHLSLFDFDKQKEKINGSIHFSVKTSNDTLISTENLKMSYEHYLAGSCVTTSYHLGENKSKLNFLKYSILQKKNRLSGCFSIKLWLNDKDIQSQYKLPDSIYFENIRFFAILK